MGPHRPAWMLCAGQAASFRSSLRPRILRTFGTTASAREAHDGKRLILGIESSCDDSCASVVSSDRRILSSIVRRQNHSSTGGIHPLTAALGHHANVPGAIVEALNIAGIKAEALDAIAVTQGPGMNSSLGVGMVAAKSLAAVLGKPIIYVHHMQAHALTPLLTESERPSFPFLTLLVSGGHTMLVLARGISDFRILATTTDDSIGDAFDKAARELRIPWEFGAPGAALEQFAAEDVDGETQTMTPTFPHPMRGRAGFSYSGLKSAVTREIERQGGAEVMSDSARRSIARAFQSAAVAQLEEKLGMSLRADASLSSGNESGATNGAKSTPKPGPRIELGVPNDRIKEVVCSGGVAANGFLRKRLRDYLDSIGRSNVKLLFPPLALCTDNAAMIAHAGQLLWHTCTNDYSRLVRSKWSIEELE